MRGPATAMMCAQEKMGMTGRDRGYTQLYGGRPADLVTGDLVMFVGIDGLVRECAVAECLLPGVTRHLRFRDAVTGDVFGLRERQAVIIYRRCPVGTIAASLTADRLR